MFNNALILLAGNSLIYLFAESRERGLDTYYLYNKVNILLPALTKLVPIVENYKIQARVKSSICCTIKT